MSRSAVRAFLHGLVDDAGLFPPARLSMERALAVDRRARLGEFGWMLGRFVCPASRLDELSSAFVEVRGSDGTPDVLPLAVVCDGDDPASTCESVARFAQKYRPTMAVETLEITLPSGGEPDEAIGRIAASVARVPGVARVFVESSFEGAWRARLGALLTLLPRYGFAAKLRCGGVSADLVPSAEQIAAFVAMSVAAGVEFKATAGLHHPMRHFNAEAGFVMHGFLNVAGAALIADALPVGEAALTAIVLEEEAAAFTLDEMRFAWRGLSIDVPQIERGRERRFRSYGSCSFSEPVEDLVALGILTASATA